MYVMEYLIYHLRPYGINAKFVMNSGEPIKNINEIDENKIIEAVRMAAARDRGAEDIVDGVARASSLNATNSNSSLIKT